VTVLGAVYKPVASIVPAPVEGESDQVTALLTAFVIVAVNCCVAPPAMVVEAGVTLIDIGTKVIVAVVNFDESALLVALTVTVV
jgi:hypothetical protein